MRKFLTLLFLLQLSLNGFSQKKFLNGFFDHIDITPHFYFDDTEDSAAIWRNFIKDRVNSLPYNFDSLASLEKRYFFHFKINGGSGILIKLQKTLAKNATSKLINKKLEWRSGIGYRFFAMSSNNYSNQNWYPHDTTKVYPDQSVKFKLTQHYADLQSTLIYKFPLISNDRAFFLFGTGLQYSLSLQSKIKEQFTSSETKWNTGLRRWTTDTLTAYKDKFNTTNSSHLYLLVPIGMEIKFSEFFKMQFETTYFYHFKNKTLPKERYSEGAFFSFTMRFKL